MNPPKPGFYVYCRELGREDDKFRVGTAMMLDVGGSREYDTLYVMIPMTIERANELERVIFVTKSGIEEIELEDYSG